MNSIPKRIEIDEILHSIVFAYQGRILSDTKRACDKPELVGFLLGNLLEQFSGFLFSGSAGERVKSFTDAYLPEYEGIDLYDILLNPLRRDFVDTLKAILPRHPLDEKAIYDFHYERRVYVEAFITDLEKGLKKSANDLLTDVEKQQHALKWFELHPVTILRRPNWYSSDETSKIYDYYLPLIKGHKLFKKLSRDSIGLNFGGKGYVVDVLIADFADRKEAVRIPLEVFIGLMDLKKPAELLGW